MAPIRLCAAHAISCLSTTTLTTRNASGTIQSQVTQSYSKSWGLDVSAPAGNQLIGNDYTDLAVA